MNVKRKTPSRYQQNAFAPGVIAAVVLFIAPLLIDNDGFVVVRFLVSILALVVAWFAIQAKHWWWVPVFVAIAVLWNPVFSFPFAGPVWTAAQPAAAVMFLIAGVMIRVKRP